jgi:hypothetical protein
MQQALRLVPDGLQRGPAARTLVSLATAVAALVLLRPAAAAELELAGYLGATLPFYEQTFPIDLRPPERPIQGIEIRQEEPLRLNAKGGLALAGGATVYFGGAFGIEARYDSAGVDIGAEPPLYSLRLSKPFPSFSTTLEPAPTVVTISSLNPVSLNLKFRTGGRTRFFFSAGASYLPEFQLAVTQPLNLRVGGIGLPPGLDFGTVTAQAVSHPDDPSQESRFGGNAGLGLQIPLGEHASLVVEGRVFFFPKHELAWEVVQAGGALTLPDELLKSLEAQLAPVVFNPAYFHLIGGIAFTF